ERADRALRWVVVTPRMHWVHHSRWQPETDSNYAGIFSFWDRLFGTFRLRQDPATLELGLDGYDAAIHATLRGCLATPFGPIKSRPGRPPLGAAAADSNEGPGANPTLAPIAGGTGDRWHGELASPSTHP